MTAPLAPLAPPALEVSSLRRRYGAVAALDGVSFSVPAGSLCGLIGQNGAGKTTLLSILATLDEDYEGSARVGGLDVGTDAVAVRRILGFVPDHAPLYDGMSVGEMLLFFAHAQGVAPARRREAVDEALAFTRLTALCDRPAAGLSKGITQRVCLARALLHDPQVLLLDEPAAGLDPRARIELKELLKQIAARGRTVLVSSHILSELGDFCDSVVVMERGRVRAAGRIDALWQEQEQAHHVTLEVDGQGAAAEALVRGLPHVAQVQRDGLCLRIEMLGPRSGTADIAKPLVLANIGVVTLSLERKNLEALFLTLTQKPAPNASIAKTPLQPEAGAA